MGFYDGFSLRKRKYARARRLPIRMLFCCKLPWYEPSAMALVKRFKEFRKIILRALF